VTINIDVYHNEFAAQYINSEAQTIEVQLKGKITERRVKV
jgi:hypothetical protein